MTAQATWQRLQQATTDARQALDGSQARVALVAAKYNGYVVQRLLDAAVDTLLEHRAKRAQMFINRVPGCFELPCAARWWAHSQKVDAVIALGAVIRGQTAHFVHVATAATHGLMQVQIDTGVPVILGVLTVDDAQQALARTCAACGNKGQEAALTALEMIALRQTIKAGGTTSGVQAI